MMADGEQVVPRMQSTNDIAAEDTAAPAAPESLVARVSSLQAVSSAVSKLSTMYESSKASSALLKVGRRMAFSLHARERNCWGVAA
jgi:hypothetical protein